MNNLIIYNNVLIGILLICIIERIWWFRSKLASKTNLIVKNISNETFKIEGKKELLGDEQINPITEKLILEGLSQFEKSKKFTENGITLGKLSSMLNSNVKYVSVIIKKHKGGNFNYYLNKLRIDYIVKKLESDENFSKYKISYLSQLSGYSSPAAFTKSFTEIVGQNPSEFIKNLSIEDKFVFNASPLKKIN